MSAAAVFGRGLERLDFAFHGASDLANRPSPSLAAGRQGARPARASVDERADGWDSLVVMSLLDRQSAARVALGLEEGP